MRTALRGFARAVRVARGRLARQRLRAMPWDVPLFVRRVRGRVPSSDVRTGPLVSIVVVEQRPEAIARRIEMLERTAYRPLELVVVADASDVTDRAPASPAFPVRFVERPPGSDPRAAINTAVAAADGELIGLLDAAVEPIRPDWLGHLVETVGAGSVGAAPVLIRARGHGLVRAGQRSADLSVVSEGIDLARSDGAIEPRWIGFGASFRWDPSRSTEDVPALSLAGILVRRSAWLGAGGLPSGYVDPPFDPSSAPFLDAEFASRLRSTGGRLTIDHRALAWCAIDEPAPPRADRPASRDVRDRWVTGGDRATFLDHLGPRIARQVLLDAIEGTHGWSVAPLRVALVGRLRLDPAGLSAVDWQVVPAVAGTGIDLRALEADVVIVTDPDSDIRDSPTGLIRVAWVSSTTPAHLDEYDVVITAATADQQRIAADTSKCVVVADIEGPNGVDELRALLRDWVILPRIGVRIGAQNWKNARSWGDYHFARSLQRYLERAGHPTRVRLVRDWSTAAAARDDATIHLFGNQVAHNRPSQVNVLWQISHPDLASPELYGTYDQVFVASDGFAALMAERSNAPVEPLHQATDPERFHPDDRGPRHELLFVANYRPDRPIVDWLVPTAHDLAVYGRAWDLHGLDPRYHRGTHIPNDELRRYYSGASIVLNDTWEDMRAAGFIPNRIYDALACGAFVLSDDVAGIVDEFDGGVAIYHDAAELQAAVERYLGDDDLRRDLASRGRSAVLERHTFEGRTATILAAIRPRLATRPARIVQSR